jgi:hypothetical protein
MTKKLRWSRTARFNLGDDDDNNAADRLEFNFFEDFIIISMCHWYFVQICKLVSNSNEKITVFYVALDGKFTCSRPP